MTIRYPCTFTSRNESEASGTVTPCYCWCCMWKNYCLAANAARKQRQWCPVEKSTPVIKSPWDPPPASWRKPKHCNWNIKWKSALWGMQGRHAQWLPPPVSSTKAEFKRVLKYGSSTGFSIKAPLKSDISIESKVCSTQIPRWAALEWGGVRTALSKEIVPWAIARMLKAL